MISRSQEENLTATVEQAALSAVTAFTQVLLQQFYFGTII